MDITGSEGKNIADCVFCGSKDFDFIFKCYDYFRYRPESFNLVRCRKCNQVCLNPRPKEECYEYGSDSHRFVDIWAMFNPNLPKLIGRFKKGKTLLDVGCGSGDFLAEMKKLGWEVCGNDISAKACACAIEELSGKSIFNNDLLLLDFKDKLFDAVTLWHVLEHLANPLDTLRKINVILKEDGLLVIETPNFGCLQSRVFKEKWFPLAAPHHIFHFSPKGLEKILEQTGFKVIKRDYFVNLHSDFVSLKRSLLRFLHLEHAPDAQGRGRANAVLALKKYPAIFKFSRIVFEIACFSAASLLAMINCGTCFRVYCSKATAKS